MWVWTSSECRSAFFLSHSTYPEFLQIFGGSRGEFPAVVIHFSDSSGLTPSFITVVGFGLGVVAVWEVGLFP